MCGSSSNVPEFSCDAAVKTEMAGDWRPTEVQILPCSYTLEARQALMSLQSTSSKIFCLLVFRY